MQDAKEEVRSRLNIEDVIGEYVRLSRAGRGLKGLSPFTDEKTPSFMVSPDKHVWYDFSSNKGGDVFSFIMLMEGLDFKDALELLARKAGVDLSLYSTGDKNLGKKKQRLLTSLSLAAQYYQQTLVKNPRALEYVTKVRGLNKKVVQDFHAGYATDSQSGVVDFLLKKGYDKQEIKEAGLTNQRGGDLFRSRIMIALADASGQVIGFTGRLLGEDKKAPKYLNTPQTILYDKSRHVFGLHLAKEEIRKQNRAVIVEGNLDVISSHQAGIKNVVAAAGTALTDQHLRVLKRLTGNISLAFDNDRAGLAATERAIGLAQALDIELSIVVLPDSAKDPDELIKENPTRWSQVTNNALPVVDWVLSEYQKRYDLTKAEGKRKFSSAALEVISKLRDAVEQEHYLSLVASHTGSTLETVKQKLESLTNTPNPQPIKHKSVSPTQVEVDPAGYQDTLLSLSLIDIKVRALIKNVDARELSGEHRQSLLSYLKAQSGEINSDTIASLLPEIATYVKIVSLQADTRYQNWNDNDRYQEAKQLVERIKNENRRNTKLDLMTSLKDAEAKGDEQEINTLKEELNKIIKES